MARSEPIIFEHITQEQADSLRGSLVRAYPSNADTSPGVEISLERGFSLVYTYADGTLTVTLEGPGWSMGYAESKMRSKISALLGRKT